MQANEVMAFDASARVEDHDDQAFDFRIEIRMGGNVPVPVVGRPLRRVAQRLGVRHRAFAQSGDFVFVRCGLKFEWLDKLRLRPQLALRGWRGFHKTIGLPVCATMVEEIAVAEWRVPRSGQLAPNRGAVA